MFSQRQIKNGLKLLGGLLPLCLITLAVVLYSAGYYDFSFIKRSTEHSVPEQTLPPKQSEEVTEDAKTDAPSNDTDSVIEDFKIPETAGVPTSDTFNSNMKIGKLSISLPTQHFCGEKSVLKQKIEYDGLLRLFSKETVKENRASVEMYMGLVMVYYDNKIDVYSGGEKILDGYNGAELTYVYELDGDGRAVFKTEDGYKVIKDGSLVDGKPENLGFLYNRGEIDTSKKAKFRKYEVCEVRDKPGAVYFSDGACMVRFIEYNTREKVSTDKEVIVDEDGDEIYLPDSSVVHAYSCGRVLISINGKYGFYAVKNAWIADCEYTYATPYSEGLAVIGREDGSKSVIDLDGNTVVPFGIYTEISECVNGVMVCYSESGGFEIIGKFGG